jgi:hypothetical protein
LPPEHPLRTNQKEKQYEAYRTYDCFRERYVFVELKITHVPLLKMEIAYAAPFMSYDTLSMWKWNPDLEFIE